MATDVNFGLQQYSTLDPRLIATCALWLDATDSSTLTLADSSVTAWNDKSGNGRHATGGTSPTRTTNGIRFNGSTQWLTTSYTARPTAESVFVVVTWTGTANGAYPILGAIQANTRGYHVNQTGGVASIQWNRNGIGGYASTSGVTTSVQFLSSGIFGSSAGTTGLNGGARSASATLTFAGTAGSETLIGRNTTAYFVGTLHEILVYSVALTESQRKRVEGYLAWKWGLQTKLPSSHSSSTFRP